MGLVNLVSSEKRTGGKVVIINWIVTIALVIFVVAVLPLLAIPFKIIVDVIEKLNVSAVIIALLGQSGLTTAVVEVRKAIENKNGRKEDKS